MPPSDRLPRTPRFICFLKSLKNILLSLSSYTPTIYTIRGSFIRQQGQVFVLFRLSPIPSLSPKSPLSLPPRHISLMILSWFLILYRICTGARTWGYYYTAARRPACRCCRSDSGTLRHPTLGDNDEIIRFVGCL